MRLMSETPSWVQERRDRCFVQRAPFELKTRRATSAHSCAQLCTCTRRLAKRLRRCMLRAYYPTPQIFFHSARLRALRALTSPRSARPHCRPGRTSLRYGRASRALRSARCGLDDSVDFATRLGGLRPPKPPRLAPLACCGSAITRRIAIANLRESSKTLSQFCALRAQNMPICDKIDFLNCVVR